MVKKEINYLFESSWENKYTNKGIRKFMSKYTDGARLR